MGLASQFMNDMDGADRQLLCQPVPLRNRAAFAASFTSFARVLQTSLQRLAPAKSMVLLHDFRRRYAISPLLVGAQFARRRRKYCGMSRRVPRSARERADRGARNGG